MNETDNIYILLMWVYIKQEVKEFSEFRNSFFTLKIKAEFENMFFLVYPLV